MVEIELTLEVGDKVWVEYEMGMREGVLEGYYLAPGLCRLEVRIGESVRECSPRQVYHAERDKGRLKKRLQELIEHLTGFLRYLETER